MMKLMLDAASPLLIAIPLVIILLIIAVIGVGIFALVRFIIKNNKNKKQEEEK